jgi:hypothetical protein
MIMFFRETKLELELKLANQLKDLTKEMSDRVISIQAATIEAQKKEISNLRSKISLMETILMPLSSKAGAAYQASLNPSPKVSMKSIVEPQLSEWVRYKKAKEDELEAEYNAEDKLNAK